MRQVYELEDTDLEKVAAKGAEVVARKLDEDISDIRLMGRLKTGLITVDDICKLFDVSRRAVYSWDLEPEPTGTKKNLYDVNKIGEQLTKS